MPCRVQGIGQLPRIHTELTRFGDALSKIIFVEQPLTLLIPNLLPQDNDMHA